MGLAGLGCGLGQGFATSGAVQGIARNPGAAGTIQTPMIIGLALIESISLYGFVIAILLWNLIS
jgi:F-type H+-transporting ATPase subunit c